MSCFLCCYINYSGLLCVCRGLHPPNVFPTQTGFDGGDCCSCTCPPDFFGRPCGGQQGDTCVDPSAPCVDGFVEAGTLTAVDVLANGYDERPGVEFGSNGCMENGCQPELTRDGDIEDDESRWSCNQGLVADGSLCAITFSFEEPQDIDYIQVAFWKTDERFRSLQVNRCSLQAWYMRCVLVC